MDFNATASELLRNHGYKPRTPGDLLHWWSEFVEQCVDGYDWTLYEFDDEISARDFIGILLKDENLAHFDEFNEFKASVSEIDDRFRNLLQKHATRPSNDNSWWTTGVLKYAGKEYCSDMDSRYSIFVQDYTKSNTD